MGVLPHVNEPNTQPIIKQFAFDGQWTPDIDPTKIGENNFALLRNFRYIQAGIAPIEGTELLTTNVVDATYRYPGDAVQMQSPFGDVLIGAFWNVTKTGAVLKKRTVDIPDTCDWDSGYLYTADTDGQEVRLAHLPRGVGFANEIESVVWEGTTALVGSLWRCSAITNLTATEPQNYTTEMRNQYSTIDSRMRLDTQFRIVVMGTTRPADSMTITVLNPNGAAVACSGYTWTASGWELLTLTDGTDVGGNSLAQTGTMSWSEDTTTDADGVQAKPAYFQGTYLYLYLFVFQNTAGFQADINYLTLNIRAQHIKDVWDGVYRTCIACEHYDKSTTTYNDFLLEVNEPSNIDYPIACRLGQMGTSDYLELAFEEQTGGVLFEMISAATNTNTGHFVVYYWNGTGYATVGTVYDDTLTGADAYGLGRTGVISWTPPAKYLERIRTKQGVTGYFYKFMTNGAFSGANSEGVLVDLISGIPAPREMKGHKFPAQYGQRPFWCGDVEGNEPNAMDYGPPNTIDVYNGMQSSDRGQRIYVGDNSELTGVSTIYNRFGSSIYETMLIFKNSSTHLMFGSGPGDYKLYTISQTYGCPAPHTVASAEIGYEMGGGAFRNICMWLSYKGPMVFDGATMIPLPGVDLYFDPRKENSYINMDYIHLARGWFDPFWKEYHLVFTVGSSATKNNTHIVYSLQYKKWFEVYYDAGDTATGTGWTQVQCNTRTENGQIVQLVLMDDGHLYRFGSGSDWHGNDLIHKVRTGDFFVGESIWIESRMQALRVGHEVPDFTSSTDYITININYYQDGSETAVGLEDITITNSDYIEEVVLLEEDSDWLLEENGNEITYDQTNQYRYVQKTQHINKVALTHQFEFIRTSTSATFFGNFGKNFLWWGFLAKPEGLDTR